MLVIYNWIIHTNNFTLYLERKKKMNYIYDILLNFTDDDNYFEFYEWKEDDCFEHIKRIPIIRISKEQMQEIMLNKIKVQQGFLDLIKGNTISYKNKKDIKYGCLICDLNKAIALEFNSKGLIISKSSLLLDEEEDVIDETSLLYEEKIDYELIERYHFEYFLTRDETFKKRYLLKEIDSLKKQKNYDKFNYLYEEVFPKDNLSFTERLTKLVTEIRDNYNSKFNDLYEIVRLTYIKK